MDDLGGAFPHCISPLPMIWSFFRSRLIQCTHPHDSKIAATILCSNSASSGSVADCMSQKPSLLRRQTVSYSQEAVLCTERRPWIGIQLLGVLFLNWLLLHHLLLVHCCNLCTLRLIGRHYFRQLNSLWVVQPDDSANSAPELPLISCSLSTTGRRRDFFEPVFLGTGHASQPRLCKCPCY